MGTLLPRIRFLAITGILLLAAWLGLKEGLDGFRDAESGPQRLAAILQITYGIAAVASLGALLFHRLWLRRAVLLWLLTVTATGAMAPVVWGGAAWTAGAIGGGATALVAGLVAWGALLHAKSAPSDPHGQSPQGESGL